MISPVHFGYNPETAVNNAFQSKSDEKNIHQKAVKEFDDFVTILKSNGVDVTIVKDTPEPHTPDSIFPNNWLSFHKDGSFLLYPMFATNRRAERKENVIETITKEFEVKKRIDLTGYEKDDLFLEGTGSMVLDRDNKIAYACLSPRTSEKVLEDFCGQMSYKAIVFHATDNNDHAIYHTNVMMCVADKYVVICLDSIKNKSERETVISAIKETGKEIIDISLNQVDHFAGNMLQVENNKGEKLLVMSSQAYTSLTNEQKTQLEAYNKIIHSSLTTIETNGGGSARCMIAEIHLQPSGK